MSLTDEDKIWINGRLERVEATFTEKLERVETTFTEKLEHVETTLLTEFHKWASPIEMRLRTHSAALRASDLELEAVADRVTKLEAR